MYGLTYIQELYRKDMGHKKLIHDKKEDVLMHRWRYPSLSLHGEWRFISIMASWCQKQEYCLVFYHVFKKIHGSHFYSLLNNITFNFEEMHSITFAQIYDRLYINAQQLFFMCVCFDALLDFPGCNLFRLLEPFTSFLMNL